MKIAFNISLVMIGGGFKGIFHALVPGIFTTAVSDKIKKLHNYIDDRDKKKGD